MPMQQNNHQQQANRAGGRLSSRLLAVLSVGFIVCSLILGSCAKMGQPDGGWYDE